MMARSTYCFASGDSADGGDMGVLLVFFSSFFLNCWRCTFMHVALILLSSRNGIDLAIVVLVRSTITIWHILRMVFISWAGLLL